MFHFSGSLLNFSVRDASGEVGLVSELFFDERQWRLRFLTADHRRIPIEQIANINEDQSTITVTDEYIEPDLALFHPELRGASEVQGYRINAKDAEFGLVHDLIFDDNDWSVRYLVVDMHRWLPGKSVLISPQWITAVDWNEESVYVDLYKHQVEDSPDFNLNRPITREYESALHDYYRRPVYWMEEDVKEMKEGIKVPWSNARKRKTG